MENEEAEENNLLDLNLFKTSFKKQDVTKQLNYQKWDEARKKKGIKVVRCPICWSYEKNNNNYHHKCKVCKEVYCQKCLKILVNGRRHDHPLDCCKYGCRDCCVDCCSGCWGEICTLLGYIFGECSNTWNHDCYDYFLMILIFLFGLPIMFTIKYFRFFTEYRVIDSCCPHWFFTVLNLMANIIYCFLYSLFYFEISFILFAPTIIYFGNIKFIGNNMYYVYKYSISEMPLIEYTVRAR